MHNANQKSFLGLVYPFSLAFISSYIFVFVVLANTFTVVSLLIIPISARTTTTRATISKINSLTLTSLRLAKQRNKANFAKKVKWKLYSSLAGWKYINVFIFAQAKRLLLSQKNKKSDRREMLAWKTWKHFSSENCFFVTKGHPLNVQRNKHPLF